MSNSRLSVRAKLVEVEIYDDDDDDGRTGHMEVRYWLEREDDVLGVANVRIYFKRTDVSLDELNASAKAHAHRVLTQIVENFAADSAGPIPEQLWLE